MFITLFGVKRVSACVYAWVYMCAFLRVCVCARMFLKTLPWLALAKHRLDEEGLSLSQLHGSLPASGHNVALPPLSESQRSRV